MVSSSGVRQPPPPGSDWPSVVVAVSILAVVGAVLLTSTIRWTQNDVARLFAALSPVIGVVTGAFVTYFFTRQVVNSANANAQTAINTANAAMRTTQDQLTEVKNRLDVAERERRDAKNALSIMLGRANPQELTTLRQDPVVARALAPPDQG